MTKQRIIRIRRKIQDARYRLMEDHPYFSLMLMYLRMVAVPGMNKMSTNGKCIYFDPDYIERMTPTELDYLLCHQIMHITTGQIWQEKYVDHEDFHFACNIIINSQLEDTGILPEHSPHLGYVYTCVPGTNEPARDLAPEQILSRILLRISILDERTKGRYMVDSDEYWDCETDNGGNGIIILDIDEKDPLVEEDPLKEKDPSPQDESSGEPDENDIDGALLLSGKWKQRAESAAQFARLNINKKFGKGGFGTPEYIRRLIKPGDKGKVDWRHVLNEFIQEEVIDYSFLPPDR